MTPKTRCAAFALSFALPTLALVGPAAAQSDGDLDPRYGASGVARHNVQSDLSLAGLACAPGGTCYISMENSASDFRVREINPAGVFVDEASAAFNLGGTNRDSPNHLAVGADGKPVLAGTAQNAVTDLMAVARFRHVGGFPPFVLDSSFSGDGKATQLFAGDAQALAVAVGPSGEVVVAGCYSSGGATGDDFAILRFLPNGDPDLNFDGNGVRTIDFNLGSAGDNDCASSVAVLPDGRIVVAGMAQFGATDYDFAVARLLTDGALDASFSGNGLQSVFFDQGTSDQDVARAIAVDRFGRIILAGLAQTDAGYKPALARLLPNGNLDTSFDGDGKFLGAEGNFAIALGVATLSYPSERILYMTFGGTLAALTESGAFDPSFGDGGTVLLDDPGADETVGRMNLAILGGMPLVGGQSVVSNTGRYFVARYWMDQIFGDDFESGNTNAWSGW